MKTWFDEEKECVLCEPNNAEEWMVHIWEIGCDYDGCNTVESLKSLIDELVEASHNARKCLHTGKVLISDTKEEDEKSHDAAFEALREYSQNKKN